MNILNIIDTIEKVDPEIYGKIDSRRSVFSKAGKFAGKVAVAAMPFALGDMFKKAYGATPANVIDVLNFALTLEYLESSFYNMGVTAMTNGTLDKSSIAVFKQIQQHENSHVAFLTSAIKAAGGTPVASPKFDFSGGNAKGAGTGPYKDYATNYQTFLALSQAFEDTGVRAYKGQAGALISNGAVLQAALQIHSVEARHAAEVRRLRGQKGWITGNQTDIPSVQAVYNGEENFTQGGATLANSNAVTEAFDEPLTYDQVNAIAGQFIY